MQQQQQKWLIIDLEDQSQISLSPTISNRVLMGNDKH